VRLLKYRIYRCICFTNQSLHYCRSNSAARELTSQRRAVSLQRLRELLSADDRHLGAPPLRPRLASVGVANDATGPAPGRQLIGQTANAAARGKLTDDDDDDDD